MRRVPIYDDFWQIVNTEHHQTSNFGAFHAELDPKGPDLNGPWYVIELKYWNTNLDCLNSSVGDFVCDFERIISWIFHATNKLTKTGDLQSIGFIFVDLRESKLKR